MVNNVSFPGASNNYYTTSDETLPILSYEELKQRQLPPAWSEAEEITSTVGWFLCALVNQTLPEDWLLTSFHAWPKAFPKKWLKLLKIRLEDRFQEKATSPEALHLLWCYGLHHYQVIYNLSDQESLWRLVSRQQISLNPITLICRSLEQPSFSKKITPLGGHQLTIFLCQFFLPQLPVDERRSALEKSLLSCAELQYAPLFQSLHKTFQTDVFKRAFTSIIRGYQNRKHSCPDPCLDPSLDPGLSPDFFLELRDLIYGFPHFIPLPHIFHLGLIHLSFLDDLTSHVKKHQILVKLLFSGQATSSNKALAWMIYKSWWYTFDLQNKEYCLIERLIYWYAVELFADQEIPQSKFVEAVQTALHQDYPLLTFPSQDIEKSFRKLHAVKKRNQEIWKKLKKSKASNDIHSLFLKSKH